MPTEKQIQDILSQGEEEVESDEEESDDTEEMVKPMADWVGKAMNQLSGHFLTIKNGFHYYIKINPDVAPLEVSKDFNGNGEFRKRIQHNAYLEKIKPTMTGKGLQVDEPETYKKVMDQNENVGEEFILEISPAVNKLLAEYVYNVKDPRATIKMKRTGMGNKTKYTFTKG